MSVELLGIRPYSEEGRCLRLEEHQWNRIVEFVSDVRFPDSDDLGREFRTIEFESSRPHRPLYRRHGECRSFAKLLGDGYTKRLTDVINGLITCGPGLLNVLSEDFAQLREHEFATQIIAFVRFLNAANGFEVVDDSVGEHVRLRSANSNGREVQSLEPTADFDDPF